MPQVVLGAVGEARAIDAARGLAARLAQDVDDALVRGGERGGLGQRLERLHGGQPRRAARSIALGPLRRARASTWFARVRPARAGSRAGGRRRTSTSSSGAGFDSRQRRRTPSNASVDQLRAAAASMPLLDQDAHARRSPRGAGRTDPCRRSAPAPMPNRPASASSLSASATACATGPSGSASPAKRGQ